MHSIWRLSWPRDHASADSSTGSEVRATGGEGTANRVDTEDAVSVKVRLDVQPRVVVDHHGGEWEWLILDDLCFGHIAMIITLR